MLDGIFYQQELQKVPEQEVFLIEKVIRTRGNQALIKWKGYPEKFNSWIPKKNIQDYQRKKRKRS